MKYPALPSLLRSFLILIITGIFLIKPLPVFAADKRIEVNLTKQRLYAYEDGILKYDFPVSTGKLVTPTPTGGFWPYVKLRYTRMIGGSKLRGDYYDLKNVPYTIYFYNANYPKGTGYALHGTYWHNNFGHPMSHGCVNLRTADMQKLYSWIDTIRYDKSGNGSGTIIHISGKTPKG